MKRLIGIAIFSFGILLVQPCFAHAAPLTITEIDYDVPGANAGRQWIEVQNTSASPVDLGEKTVRLTDKNGAHLIKAYRASSELIPIGGVAVIAENPEKFLVDWPAYAGTVLKSSFSLTESGEVGLKNGSGVLAAVVSYSSSQGANGDGNSLQLSGSRFISGKPTPGIVPATIPAPLISKSSTKLVASSKSSSKSKKTKAVTSNTHDKGTLAPADAAETASAGAVGDGLPAFSFSMPAFLSGYVPLFSSVWFNAFLALMAFSAFSLLVLQKGYYL